MLQSGKIIKESILIVSTGILLVGIYYFYIKLGGPKSISADSIATVKTEAVKKVSDRLNILFWEEYLSDSAITGFEKQYGVHVNIEYFDDEDVLLSTIMSYSGKYDICVASGMYIAKMSAMKLLAEIDLDNLPDLKNINPKFIDPAYDRGNKYSIPYMWGTTGLVINKKYVKEDNPDWNVLFNPDYAGHIAMINDQWECFAVPLKCLGSSLNTDDFSTLEKASAILIQQKELGVQYLGELEITEQILSGELWAALTYSGIITGETYSMDEIDFLLPEQGYSIWVDNLCIPVDSPHKHTAELFINYILDAKVSAEIANTYYLANANKAAAEYTLHDIITDERVYPSDEVLDKGESFSYDQSCIDVQKLFNRTWQMLTME